MTVDIGILYESKEWSNFIIEKYINELGVNAKLFDMEEDGNDEEILSCKMLVSRVFGSGQFRDHKKSLQRMPLLLRKVVEKGIPIVNSAKAHSYEIDKNLYTKELKDIGIPVPKVFGVFTPEQIVCLENLEFPCIVKPNCGGRTTFTFLVENEAELKESMRSVPNIDFIVQEYLNPQYGYLTRIEIIGGECILIVKRSVASNGLSAYHLGSTYEHYNECSDVIKKVAIKAMNHLEIEVGSVDIIENEHGFYIIDVNSMSNVAEESTEIFSCDLMKEAAKYVIAKYRKLFSSM